jgi:hypothetical protein
MRQPLHVCRPESGPSNEAHAPVGALAELMIIGKNERRLARWRALHCKEASVPVTWIRNTPTATRQWHDLKVRIAGTKVAGYLDGKLNLEHVLPQPVS